MGVGKDFLFQSDFHLIPEQTEESLDSWCCPFTLDDYGLKVLVESPSEGYLKTSTTQEILGKVWSVLRREVFPLKSSISLEESRELLAISVNALIKEKHITSFDILLSETEVFEWE